MRQALHSCLLDVLRVESASSASSPWKTCMKGSPVKTGFACEDEARTMRQITRVWSLVRHAWTASILKLLSCPVTLCMPNARNPGCPKRYKQSHMRADLPCKSRTDTVRRQRRSQVFQSPEQKCPLENLDPKTRTTWPSMAIPGHPWPSDRGRLLRPFGTPEKSLGRL